MSPVLAALVATAVVEGAGTAVALDDGTVWMAYDGEWEELGGCEDGDVVALEAGGGALAIRCGDGTAWSWSEALGWQPGLAPSAPAPTSWDVELRLRPSWWPTLELSTRVREAAGPPTYEAWVRLRWSL